MVVGRVPPHKEPKSSQDDKQSLTDVNFVGSLLQEGFAGYEVRTASYCGRGSSRASNLALHSPSMMPSTRSGRKRRWKAITAFCSSVTS